MRAMSRKNLGCLPQFIVVRAEREGEQISDLLCGIKDVSMYEIFLSYVSGRQQLFNNLGQHLL